MTELFRSADTSATPVALPSRAVRELASLMARSVDEVDDLFDGSWPEDYVAEWVEAATIAVDGGWRNADVPDEREIGYVCGRGHFQFLGDEDYAACGSKRIAAVVVRRDAGVEFYSGDDFGSGYSEEEYEAELDDAHRHLLSVLAEWRRS